MSEMSQFFTEVPQVVVKQGKMAMTSKLKGVALVLVLLFYVYVLLLIKTFYLRSKKLDHMLEMVLETEKKMLNVHNTDQKLALQMAQVDKLYEDY